MKKFEIKAIQTNFPIVDILDSKTSYDVIKQFYLDDINIFESFFILLLNKANKTIGFSKISQGGICGTVVDIKLIAKYCIDSLASGVILCHNHPSGSIKPSFDDKQITEKIKNGLKLLDITVLDHLIITSDRYFSFADEGILNN